MSRTIDERVVEMRFDNRDFESNVKTSLSTLNKLEQSLDLSGASKGLDAVGHAAKRIDLSSLGSAVETVHARFSALEVIAVTALANITNSAVNAGKRIVSALTIDPIKTGFSEYETQINAVQTILANTSHKGTTLDQVNATLDQLNEYADKTIYNFTQMTKNIGTFTAAGLGLEESASAIQGIANLAAVSGSTSQQASTAMYQLSQALASGRVSLQDWNSVVNAGMGGKVFQDALVRTAAAMKGVSEETFRAQNIGKSFRESLNAKNGTWLTTDVLSKTLRQFTMAAEEGSKEWEEFKKSLKEQGYTDKQAEEILKMANTATDAATKVKTFTQLWDTLKEFAQSGWTQSWEIIVGDFEEAKELLTDVSNTIGAMIGASAEARNSVLQGWKDLGGRTAVIDAVRSGFEGIISVITPIKEAFKEIFPPITAQQLYNLSKTIKDISEKFKISDVTATNLKNTFKGLFAVIDLGRQALAPLLGLVKPIAGALMVLADEVLKITGPMGEYVVALNETAKKTEFFKEIFDDFAGFIVKIGGNIAKVFGKIGGAIESIGKINTSGLEAVTEKIQVRFEPLTKLAGLVGKAFGIIAKTLSAVAPIIFKFAGMVGEAFGKLMGYVSEAVKSLEFNDLMDLINTVLLGNIFVGIKKFIKSLSDLAGEGSGFLGFIKDILNGVKDSLAAMQSSLKAKTLMTIASAMGILTASIVALSLIDSGKLTSALTAISVLFVELFGSMSIFGKLSKGKGIKSITVIANAMKKLSEAVLILSIAMNMLADLDWGGIFKGLIGIAGLSATLVVSATQLSKNSNKLKKSTKGLIVFAGAVVVLTEAVKRLGELDVPSLTKGLIGVGVLMTELAIFMRATDLNKMGITKGTGLLIFAAAMNVLAIAVEKIGALNPDVLVKGLVSIGTALFIVTKAMNAMPKGMVTSGVGMIAVSGALVILAKALSDMGDMGLDVIAKGLVTLGASLFIISKAMAQMTTALPGAAALLVISAALNLLVPVIKNLGSMSIIELGLGLLSLAAAFGVLGGAAVLLSPLTPALLGLSAAIVLFGVGCVAVGAGILAFSAGLSALAVSGTAGAAALVTIVTAIIGLIPAMLTQIANGVISFAKVIADGAVVIAGAIVKVLVAIMDAIITTVPKVVQTVGTLLDAMLKAVVNFVPKLVTAGMQLLVGILTGIANNIYQVVTIAVNIVTNFIDAIARNLPGVINAGVNLIVSFITGLANAISSNTPRVTSAIKELFRAVLNAGVDMISSFVSDFMEAGKNIVEGLIDGIKSAAGRVVEAAKGVVKSALDGAKRLLGINSPSKAFAEIGRWSDEGMVVGLKTYAKRVVDAAKGVGEGAIDGMSDAFSNVSNIISSDMDLDPTIRPVIDLSNIESGFKTLNAMFSREQALGISAAMTTRKQSGEEIQNGVNGPSNGSTFSFTQINNSPKALNRIEIYRQTKNQISSMKELVNAR